MLKTNLKHLNSETNIKELLTEHEKVMICCGRMGPMYIPVYRIMEKIEKKYPDVAFRDIEFDIPAAAFIKKLAECASFMGLPFTVYFRNGKPVSSTAGIQCETDVTEILNRVFH